ncbi:hypothetical protein CVV38_02065 [Candidatus Peregrinibacteria bacterium HGW-Peregrinibacteria-1]|jgi:hypothetical protein|nr:MAG: hypothetical protein CVV38_02065 [Candidatus Peregrinibacteria bacterium HGW-Peregrinibacteria-1]
MEYRKIISDAWALTQNSKRLIIWFGFIPAIFTTIVAVGMILYQYIAFKNSPFFGAQEGIYRDIFIFIWDYITGHTNIIIPIIIVGIFFAIFYLLYPILAKATAIQIIARKRNGQSLSLGDGLKYAFGTFLPLLQYKLLVATFSVLTIVNEVSVVVRNFGPGTLTFMLPLFGLILIAGLVMTLLFTYAEFFIVIDREDVFTSIRKSTRLVIYNWKHTFLVTLLMLLIGLRIVIQALVVFLLPAVILFISGYIATLFSIVPAVIVGVILGLIVLIMTAYLNGIVDVFSYSVWTFTFLELTEQEEVAARSKVESKEA